MNVGVQIPWFPSVSIAFATMVQGALAAGCHQSSRQDRRMERHDITGSEPQNATPLAELNGFWNLFHLRPHDADADHPRPLESI